MIQSDALGSQFHDASEDTTPPLWRRAWAHPRIVLVAAAFTLLALVAAIAGPALLSGDFGEEVGRGPAGSTGASLGQTGDGSLTISPYDTGEAGFLTANYGTGITASTYDEDVSTPKAASVPDTAPAPEPTGQTALETSGRSIISNSSLAIEIDNVPGAIDQLRVIANSAGGFIETLSTTGGADPDRGNATIRVPGSAFLATLQRVKEIGTVVGETVGSDDVTEQVIDLQARLRSEQAKEISFLELLGRADSVSDLLNIERELSRVRTEIERLTGQLSFIEQRVDLATIHVSFGQPASLAAEPPSASLAVETGDAEDAIVQLKAIVEQVGGEIDSTSVSLNNGVMQAFVALRVMPADSEDTLFRFAQLGDVTAKEVREPGAASALPESDEATARITVTLNQVESPRNWWLWAGTPAAAVALLLLLAISYRAGQARNHS
jgi:hypothetical protein